MKLPSIIMTEKLDLEPNEYINVDSNEDISEKSKKKKLPICERHWIFKRNQDCTQRRKHPYSASTESGADVNTYYEDHLKFLAYLGKLQRDLPHEKANKSGIVDQVVTDSVDIKNLFVNSTTRPKCNINMKALTASDKKNDGVARGSTFSSRSLRLFRKCKVNHIVDDPSDPDLLFTKSTTSKSDVVSKSKTTAITEEADEVDKVAVDNASRTTATTTTTTTGKLVEENSIDPLDELLDGEAFEPAKNKKRKVQGVNIMSDIQNMAKRYISKPAADIAKKFTTHNQVNGDRKKNVIEIADNENDAVSPNKEEKKKKAKVSCPMCSKDFPASEINDHAYTCQGPQTITRNQQSSKDSQEYSGGGFDAACWESACQGLNTTASRASPKKEKQPVESLDDAADRNVFTTTKATTYSNRNYKIPKIIREKDEDPLADLKASNKIRTEIKSEHTTDCKQARQNVNKQSRLTVRTTGYQNLALDENTHNIIEGYAKTINRISRNPPAKLMRSFGERASEESESARCSRCDQFVPDDQLKEHTDKCLEQSMEVE